MEKTKRNAKEEENEDFLQFVANSALQRATSADSPLADVASDLSDDDGEERRGGPRMGRKKIKIEKISDSKNRQVTFNKRKVGLLKKAIELSVLCDCEVSLLIFHSEKLYEYSSKPLGQTLKRYLDYEGSYEVLDNSDLTNLRPGKASSIRVGRKQKFDSFDDLLSSSPPITSDRRRVHTTIKRTISSHQDVLEASPIPQNSIVSESESISRKRKAEDASPLANPIMKSPKRTRHEDSASDSHDSNSMRDSRADNLPISAVSETANNLHISQVTDSQRKTSKISSHGSDTKGSPQVSAESFGSPQNPYFQHGLPPSSFIQPSNSPQNMVFLNPQAHPEIPQGLSNYPNLIQNVIYDPASGQLQSATGPMSFPYSQSSMVSGMGFQTYPPGTNNPQIQGMQQHVQQPPMYYYQTPMQQQDMLAATSREPHYVITATLSQATSSTSGGTDSFKVPSQLVNFGGIDQTSRYSNQLDARFRHLQAQSQQFQYQPSEESFQDAKARADPNGRLR